MEKIQYAQCDLELKPHYPFITRLLISLFLHGDLPDIRQVDVEPEYGRACRIIYHNGSVQMIRGQSLGINNHGASEIAKDKGYTKHFLQSLGYATPVGKVFLLQDYITLIEGNLSRYGFREYAAIEDIYAYISSEIGYPCFIKPNASSQGHGVMKCFNQEDVEFAVLLYQQERRRIVLVEEAVEWPDYRIVILKGEVISCYLRKPLSLIGDGCSSIEELLQQKQQSFINHGRDTLIKMDDPRIRRCLARNNYSLETILKAGEVYQVHDISNLSAGGEAEDYTSIIAQHWRDLCIRLVSDMGLIFCGVDLACSDLTDAHAGYSILEINAAPGLDNYAASGEKQAAIVKELYKKVLNDGGVGLEQL